MAEIPGSGASGISATVSAETVDPGRVSGCGARIDWRPRAARDADTSGGNLALPREPLRAWSRPWRKALQAIRGRTRSEASHSTTSASITAWPYRQHRPRRPKNLGAFPLRMRMACLQRYPVRAVNSSRMHPFSAAVPVCYRSATAATSCFRASALIFDILPPSVARIVRQRPLPVATFATQCVRMNGSPDRGLVAAVDWGRCPAPSRSLPRSFQASVRLRC